MAPVTVFFLGITFLLTYIAVASDYSQEREGRFNSPPSKQRSRDIIAIPPRFLTSQTQDRRLPEISLPHEDDLLYQHDIFYNHGGEDHGRTRADLRWGSWSSWSLCSRSCGGGVAKRYRRCTRRDPTTCVGSPVAFTLCNTLNCPEGAPTFREEQCTEHSKRIMTGKLATYSWYPYSNDGVHTCLIYCTAEQVRFVQFHGVAVDGTRCGEEGKDVCIEGNCVEVGCDMEIGSQTIEDACGVCGGDNSTCSYHSDIYDYIPEVVALMEADDHFEQYIVNGNKILSWPGKYETAGTTVSYDRIINDTIETFQIKGPTTKDLYIMILFMGSIPRIEYEYWMPMQSRSTLQMVTSTDLRKHYGSIVDRESAYAYSYSTKPDYLSIPYVMADFQSTSKPETQTSSTKPATTTQPTQSTTREVSTSAIRRPLPYTSASNSSTVPTANADIETPEKPCRRSPNGCRRCKKARNKRLSYCKGDFAIRAKILSKRRYHHGQDIRYDVEIRTTYKSDFRLIPREYIWVSSDNCPKLRPLREYLLIGRKVQVDVTDRDGAGSETPKSHVKRYETRLVVEKTDYWARWRKSYEVTMEKIANRLKCERYLRRKFTRQQRKVRGKKAKQGRIL